VNSGRFSIQNNMAAIENSTDSISIHKENNKISTGKVLGAIVGREELKSLNGYIQIEYGEILED